MFYMPYLRVRSAVLIYAYMGIGITLFAVALRFWPGAVHYDGHELSNVHVDLTMLLSGSAALVGGFATVLGLNLASENDGHLELAWTKPVSRDGYALGVFAVDIGAMAACLLFTVLCVAIVVDVYAGGQAISLGSGDHLLGALALCGFPLCVYAWITALSASVKRNRGSIAGMFWPLMIAVAALHFVPFAPMHAVANALYYINPLELYTARSHQPAPLGDYLWGWALSAALLVVALVQWRRLEL
jgi:ABC-type transport system involved in multi-copper enzyme maturation permease subunit